MRAFVDQDLCIGCGMDDVMTAIEGCPVSAIREEE